MHLNDNELKIISFFLERGIDEATLGELKSCSINDPLTFYSTYLSLLKKGILKEMADMVVWFKVGRFTKLYLNLKYNKSAELLLFLTYYAQNHKMTEAPVHRRMLRYNPRIGPILGEAERRTFYNALNELRERGFLKLAQLEEETVYFFYLDKVPEIIQRFMRPSSTDNTDRMS